MDNLDFRKMSRKELNDLSISLNSQLNQIGDELGQRRLEEMKENIGKYYVDRYGGYYKILGVAPPKPTLTGKKNFSHRYYVCYIPVDIKEHEEGTINPIEFYQEQDTITTYKEVSKNEFLNALDERLKELRCYFETID